MARHGEVEKVWRRDGGICWLCELPVPLESATVDHVVPRSSPEFRTRPFRRNLRLAHKWCNWERADGVTPHPGVGAMERVRRSLLNYKGLTWVDPQAAKAARDKLVQEARDGR